MILPRCAAIAVALLVVAGALCSCDIDIFGTDTKLIAADYRLKRTENPHDYALFSPEDRFGRLVSEIGWRAPLIIARPWGGKEWDVIDTKAKLRSSITEMERTSDPQYRDIKINDAMDAWELLQRDTGVW